MRGIRKTFLGAAIAATVFSTSGANACSTCSSAGSLNSDIGTYSTDVQGGFRSAAQTTADTIETVTVGFTSSANQIASNGQDIVAAIQANARVLGMELTMSREAQLRLLDGLKESMEALERSAMMADSAQEIAETYGPENVPTALCNAWSRIDARQQAEEAAARIMADHREKQIEDRADEFRVSLGDAFTADLVSVNSQDFSEVEAEIALEQISIITGERSFPVSPDIIALQALDPGSATPQTQQVMAAWLRTANASSDVAGQVAKRVKPDVQDENGLRVGDVSIMSDLWSAVSEGVSGEGNIEDGSASRATLLRSIAHRGGVSNRIRMEQLEATLARVRLGSSQLGYMNENAMRHLDEFFARERASASSRGGRRE
ncbi:hypothetical protein [Marinimicrobium sp. ABcell2]|uniref:hypothetical protein n=1 Tax=Marinimicrobium sp. ABcell2 TaxID=3069751 RepID=UPI0027B4D673|nr:hypothetical protein [Marinimicrobium sp. ABcell2]MDQ2077527.1 hypothetical protein [Marinimicrobium sp. ABcell2]